jgi:hypothetical protein
MAAAEQTAASAADPAAGRLELSAAFVAFHPHHRLYQKIDSLPVGNVTERFS